jgi:hypothetical protein
MYARDMDEDETAGWLEQVLDGVGDTAPLAS